MSDYNFIIRFKAETIKKPIVTTEKGPDTFRVRAYFQGFVEFFIWFWIASAIETFSSRRTKIGVLLRMALLLLQKNRLQQSLMRWSIWW